MDTSGLDDQLRERLAIILDIDPSTIANDTPFEEIQLDSMARLELVALVEQRVGYELPEEDWGGLGSIDAIVGYVEGLGAG